MDPEPKRARERGRPSAPPERIVSLVPSLTEALFALGLGDRVVGVTDWCVHPAEDVARLPVDGGASRRILTGTGRNHCEIWCEFSVQTLNAAWGGEVNFEVQEYTAVGRPREVFEILVVCGGGG